MIEAKGAGRVLADRLGLTIVRQDGRDLRVACVHSCGSADNGHIDEDSGVYGCWSCGKGLSPWDLCKVVLHDHERAKRLMIDVGLFEDRPHSQNGNGKPSASGSSKPSDNAIIDQVAQSKGTTGDGFRALGAVVKSGCVTFPTFQLTDGKAERISYFYIDPKNPSDKGKNAKDKPAGVFLPVIPAATASDSPRVRRPQPGETWIICEGPKNAAAYAMLGRNAVGLNGKHIRKDFLPGFVAAFKGVDVVLIPDGDLQSAEAFKKLGAALHGTAKSVRLASLPYGELRATGGDDVRDVLKRSGPKAVQDAIQEAKPVEERAGKTRPATTLEPGTRVYAGDRGNIGEIVSDNGGSCLVHFVSPEGQTADVDLPKSQLRSMDGQPVDGEPAEPPRFIETLMTSQQLDDLDAEPRYIVKNAVPAGQVGAIGAKSKGCKTGIATDLAISIASGTRFLNEFEVPEPAPVLDLCGESGASKIRRQARHICEARGLALRDLPIIWGFDLPKLCLPAHVDALAEIIRKEKIGLAIIDPLYLSLFTAETAGRSGDLYTMGATFEPLTAVCRETGASILLVHHFRKNRGDDQQEPCSLEELSQAGLAEVARWWLLIERREPYAGDGRHSLWLRVGGSEGHASFWGLNIDEGLGLDSEGNQRTTKWETTLTRVEDTKAEEKRQRESRKAADLERQEGEHVEKLVAALRKYPAGETGRQLRADSRLNSDNFLRAVASLKQAGRIEELTIAKKRGSYDGYRLTK